MAVNSAVPQSNLSSSSLSQESCVVDFYECTRSGRRNFSSLSSFFTISSFFSLEPMVTPFASLRAQLDAAPADGLPATPVGGVRGIEDLSLAEQGASPGTPAVRATKMFYPVLLNAKETVCLSVIGQGATFCLRNSCSIASHKDALRRFPLDVSTIVIKKSEAMAFCEPSAPSERMDKALSEHWMSHPKTLADWSEALLAYKRCVESLALDSGASVTAAMLTAKKKFQREAQEIRTPARVLFSNDEDKADEFVDVSVSPAISPYKPGLSLLGSTKFSDSEKNLARHIKRVETGLEVATHNLIQQRAVLKDQDTIVRGLESRLDTVQDHLGATPLGLSDEFEAPTVNGRVAVLAERISTLHSAQANLSEPQVLNWVNQWWGKSDMKLKIAKSDDFSNDCEAFLTSLVTSFKSQGIANEGCCFVLGSYSSSSAFGCFHFGLSLTFLGTRGSSAGYLNSTSPGVGFSGQ
jgi:hypothetical protein